MRLRFQDLLAKLDNGELPEKINAEIEKVVAAVHEAGAKGSVTLTLEIAPFNDRDPVPMTVAPKLSSKIPVPPCSGMVAFSDPTGELSDRDSRQMDIEQLRVVAPRSSNKGSGE